MPTYQYVCTECEQPLEVVQGFNDDRLTECRACAGRLRQVFSAVGVVFKGSGFYRNDSRGTKSGGPNGDSPKTDTKADSTPSAGSDASSTSTAEKSTPAAKPAAPPAKSASDSSGKVA